MPQSAIDQPTDQPDSTKRIQPSDLGQMGSDFFTAMLGMPFALDPIKDAAEPEPNALLSSIRVEGTWNATFRVAASKALASEIASSMFGVAIEQVSAEDALDALGETVNVFGGNAKGIVNEECNLSLPCIGQYEALEDQGEWMVSTFDCNGHPLTLQVREQASA
jgi:hypothetical protein